MSDDAVIAAFFEEAEELLADFEAGLLQLEAGSGNLDPLHAIFRTAHTLKGNSAMLGFDEIARVTHLLEDLLDQLRKGRREASTRVVDALLYAADVMRTMLVRVRSGAEPSSEEQEAADDLMSALRALVVGEAPPVAPVARAAARVSIETSSIRVSVDKLDRLIDLVGELVLIQSMVADAVTVFSPERLPGLRAAVALMDRRASELREHVMAVRMVPIRALFAQLPRLVRDVSAAVGKSAALEMSGEDTELDRTVIEKLGDPLAHLVRNAVDHGLEPPAARRALGKPDVGRLRVAAYQEDGDIYIEITDDGRGLDRDRLHARARELGIAGDEPLDDEQVFDLIFRPGFSTAENVTALSGRGVGMDVVRRNVEAIGGSIAIRSERGRGTTFRIKLPPPRAVSASPALRPEPTMVEAGSCPIIPRR